MLRLRRQIGDHLFSIENLLLRVTHDRLIFNQIPAFILNFITIKELHYSPVFSQEFSGDHRVDSRLNRRIMWLQSVHQFSRHFLHDSEKFD